MWWHILEVNPEDDEKAVKKAYAIMIKGIDQDTEIDEFTKVHGAFRMAMKSFKKKKRKPTKVMEYLEEAGWYLDGLDRIYNDSVKRLDASAWKNLFACMSFKEEKQFIDEYVEFFNQHYFLTDEIWSLVEANYPLGNQKDFKWKDQCNGNLKVKEKEIIKLPYEKAIQYVEYKITVYYAILDKTYEHAMALMKEIFKDSNSCDINRWYMVVAGELGDREAFDAAYNKMKSDAQCAKLAEHYYVNYSKRFSGSETTLSCCDLNQLSKKQKVLLSKGDYEKALSADEGTKKRLFSWRGGK